MQSMNNIDKLTSRLAAQEPELKGADDLLESIMNNLPEQEEIEQMPAEDIKLVKKSSLWLSIGRWSSSIAALFLIALFISQKISAENTVLEADYSEVLSAYRPDYTSFKQSDSPEEVMRAVMQEKKSRVKITELYEQYAQIR